MFFQPIDALIQTVLFTSESLFVDEFAYRVDDMDLVCPQEPVPGPAAAPEPVPGAAEANLGYDFACQMVSADLLELVRDDVPACVRPKSGGAGFDCQINLLGDHWLVFDLRSLIMSRLPETDTTTEDVQRAERLALASYVRKLAREVSNAVH